MSSFLQWLAAAGGFWGLWLALLLAGKSDELLGRAVLGIAALVTLFGVVPLLAWLKEARDPSEHVPQSASSVAQSGGQTAHAIHNYAETMVIGATQPTSEPSAPAIALTPRVTQRLDGPGY